MTAFKNIITIFLQNQHPMTRRVFFKNAAAAGLSLALPIQTAEPFKAASPPQKIDIAVAHGSSAGRTTRAAIDALGGISAFVSRGDVVVVKPNIGFDRPPEYAATTNPEVIGEIVRLCVEAGAREVKVFDRPVNDPRRCYIQSGIAAAARRAGAVVAHIDDRKFRDTDLGGIALKSWPLYRDVLEADRIINVPIAKHHGLATLTLSMKNLMGVIGGSRYRIHQNIDECLVDITRRIKPTLTVLDAVRILITNGPQGGDLRDVRRLDRIIAGVDPVAVDAYGATLFGLTGSDLGYVRIGDEAGLGKMDLAKLVIQNISLRD